MKRLFVPFLALATLCFLGSSAYAQRPGGGKPSGVGGGPGSGGGSSAAHGNMASAGSTSTSSPSSPGTVLSRNPKVGPALTNALKNSGINLPAGQTLADVCTKSGTSGFRTLGQCIAALHINHKFPGCSLADLANAKSLGKAIQGCNPNADAKTEVHDATKQANQEIKESGS